MLRAVWRGAVVAESDRCQKVEGNWYFPPNSLRKQYLRLSSTRTECSWKGTAHYYHLVVSGLENTDGAWYYPRTKLGASHIKRWVAFWRGVEIRGEELKD